MIDVRRIVNTPVEGATVASILLSNEEHREGFALHRRTLVHDAAWKRLGQRSVGCYDAAVISAMIGVGDTTKATETASEARQRLQADEELLRVATAVFYWEVDHIG